MTRAALLLLLLSGCSVLCRRASTWTPQDTDSMGPAGCWVDDRDGGDGEVRWK